MCGITCGSRLYITSAWFVRHLCYAHGAASRSQERFTLSHEDAPRTKFCQNREHGSDHTPQAEKKNSTGRRGVGGGKPKLCADALVSEQKSLDSYRILRITGTQNGYLLYLNVEQVL